MVPKESSWFGSEEISDSIQTSNSQYPLITEKLTSERAIIPMRLQPLYLEDWIGLRELDERGDISFETCQGEHMQLGDCWKDLVIKYVGGKV